MGIWFLSWLVESLSFRWVHAQQLRPLTVGRGACHREEVNICQELLHFLKIGAPIFGPTEVYSYIINYTPSTNWKILKNYEKLFFWSTAILQSVIKKHCKKQSRRIPSKTIRTYLIFGQVFLKPGVKLIWHDGAACACAANKKGLKSTGEVLVAFLCVAAFVGSIMPYGPIWPYDVMYNIENYRIHEALVSRNPQRRENPVAPDHW